MEIGRKLKEEDGRWEVEREEVIADEEKGLELEEMREGWSGDVKGGYERATEELGSLVGLRSHGGEVARGAVEGGSLTETVGRVQRARMVAMEFD